LRLCTSCTAHHGCGRVFGHRSSELISALACSLCGYHRSLRAGSHLKYTSAAQRWHQWDMAMRLQGSDTFTEQDVALLSKIAPSRTAVRTAATAPYPSGSSCGFSGSGEHPICNNCKKLYLRILMLGRVALPETRVPVMFHCQQLPGILTRHWSASRLRPKHLHVHRQHR
jgi:hypothetical protein